MTSQHFMEKVHGPLAAGVPRWAVVTAYLIHLAVLPSCVWRVAGVVFGAPMTEPSAEQSGGQGLQMVPDDWAWLYVIGLSIISEALAFLSFGLVRRWGEVFPRWIPVLHGQPVPIRAAVIPAAIGSVLLVMLCAWYLYADLVLIGPGEGPVTHGWQTVAFAVAYVPLLAWGPLLGVLTMHYYRRRRSAGVIRTLSHVRISAPSRGGR